MKRKIILLLSFLVVLIPYSCEDIKLLVDCDKCFNDLTDQYSIEFKVTLDRENSFVPITLYQGKIDNGVIISRDTIRYQPYYSNLVNFGEFYSAVAEYSHKGRTIFAVDGQKLRKKLDDSSCGEACYTIQGDVLDLRLK